MINNLGYDKFLFVLPFDHRSSFEKGLFGVENVNLTDVQRKIIRNEKEIIYEAFKKAVSDGIPKEFAAILVDEEFGDSILRDAKNQGFITLLTTEKSGLKEFAFEYGNKFGEHIKKYKPTFVKALIRFNPDDDPKYKTRQTEELRKLSEFCHRSGFKFLLEVLIPSSDKQLKKISQDKKRYDKELRPNLAIDVIKEFQENKVEPDVWKMEGMEKEKDYSLLVAQARIGGRENVGIVVLGRGAEKERVDKWVFVGSKVSGVIGFAVGRTVFWQPLILLKDGEITRDEAISEISKNYKHYYDLFIQGRSRA